MKVKATIEFEVEDGFTEQEVQQAIREWADGLEPDCVLLWVHGNDPNDATQILVHDVSAS